MQRPWRSLGSTGRNADHNKVLLARSSEATLHALTDISRIERKRHAAKLEVDDLGHGTRNSVSSLSITENIAYALA